jgi:hypothetical protein
MFRTDGDFGRSALFTDADGFSAELWLTPTSSFLLGAPRVFSLSSDTQNRNFSVSHVNGAVDVRVRTTASGENATFQGPLAGGAFTGGQPTHIVVNVIGRQAFLFQDGVALLGKDFGGDPSNWSDAMPLVLGNERTGDRAWLGTVHLAALHRRSLDPAEILRNHRLGPDGTRGAVRLSDGVDPVIADVDEDAVPDTLDRCVGFANANQTIPCAP